MFKLLVKLLFVFTLSINLYASDTDFSKSKNTTQEAVVSLYPAPAQSNVYPDADIDIVFNITLDEKQIKPNSIWLRRIDGQNIEVEGELVYNADEKKLSYIPNSFLKPGIYELDINNIKASKDFKDTNIKNITYRFKVSDIEPEFLKITPTPIEVKEGGSLNLKAAVIYSDGSENEITNSIKWESQNIDILKIEQNATASGVKEGETTITASYKGLISDTTKAIVYLEINGYRLPPEPNPQINNSTLLGIDLNNNGVRDDVERKIFFHYKRPIEQAFVMQDAPWYQKVLKDPISAAVSEDLQKELWNLSTCKGYLILQGIKISNIVEFMEEAYFNTKDRMRAYIEFNQAMSGGVYSMPLLRDANKDNCEFDVDELIGMEQ